MIHLKNLPLPCTVNSMYRAFPMNVKGRVIFKQILSKRARDRRKLFVAAVHEQLGGAPVPMTGSVQITYTVTPRDKRIPDADAHAKHLLDCLQHAGVYLNDQQVVHINVERLQPKFPGSIDVQINEID